VGDGGRAYPALGTDDRDLLTNKRTVGINKQVGDRPDDLDRLQRWHEVFADTACDQLPVKPDIIDHTHDHDLDILVAMLGQRINLAQNLLRLGGRFDHKEIGGRVLLHVGRGGRNAAGNGFECGPAHAAVTRADIQHLARFLTLVEHLDRDGRQRHITAILVRHREDRLVCRDRLLGRFGNRAEILVHRCAERIVGRRRNVRVRSVFSEDILEI